GVVTAEELRATFHGVACRANGIFVGHRNRPFGRLDSANLASNLFLFLRSHAAIDRRTHFRVCRIALAAVTGFHFWFWFTLQLVPILRRLWLVVLVLVTVSRLGLAL